MRVPQVMHGYLTNPEATAATIDDDGRLQTGDIATVESAVASRSSIVPGS